MKKHVTLLAVLFLSTMQLASQDAIALKDKSAIDAKKTSNPLDLGENLFAFHFLDFIVNSFTVSYERIIADGKYGIQIPVSFGYSDETTTIYFPVPFEPDYTNKLVNKFYTGVSFNVYPTGQGTIKYFLGPAVRFGNGLYYENADDYGEHKQDHISTGYIKFLISNGVVLTIANTLSISAVGSIGIQHMYKADTDPTQTTGALSVNMSFRF